MPQDEVEVGADAARAGVTAASIPGRYRTNLATDRKMHAVRSREGPGVPRAARSVTAIFEAKWGALLLGRHIRESNGAALLRARAYLVETKCLREDPRGTSEAADVAPNRRHGRIPEASTFPDRILTHRTPGYVGAAERADRSRTPAPARPRPEQEVRWVFDI